VTDVREAGDVAFVYTGYEMIDPFWSHEVARSVASTGRVVTFDAVRLVDGETVQSRQRCTVLVTETISEALPPNIDPVLNRVRSLRPGAEMYVTRSQRLGHKLPSPRPFAIRIELQANLPAARYMIEVAARAMPGGRDIATGPAAVFQVESAGEFIGSVQLNASMTSALNGKAEEHR
jgi:hypothetical protein